MNAPCASLTKSMREQASPVSPCCLRQPRQFRSANPPASLVAKAAACRITIVRHTDDAIVSDFTHFVTTGDLVLSLHVLLAIADARPIVPLSWLEQSVATGAPLDAAAHLVLDRKAERAHKFCYQTSWDAARQRRLLEGATGSKLACLDARAACENRQFA